jgi:hypothetical protein
MFELRGNSLLVVPSSPTEGPGATPPLTLVEVPRIDPRHLQKMAEETNLERLVSMDGDREPDVIVRPGVDVLAAVDSSETPAAPLEEAAEFLAGEGRHTAISSTRSDCFNVRSRTSMDRHPSTASCTFLRSSSRVSPSLAHPGIAGTSAQNPPSSASWTTTLIFNPTHLRCTGQAIRRVWRAPFTRDDRSHRWSHRDRHLL